MSGGGVRTTADVIFLVIGAPQAVPRKGFFKTLNLRHELICQHVWASVESPFGYPWPQGYGAKEPRSSILCFGFSEIVLRV